MAKSWSAISNQVGNSDTVEVRGPNRRPNQRRAASLSQVGTGPGGRGFGGPGGGQVAINQNEAVLFTIYPTKDEGKAGAQTAEASGRNAEERSWDNECFHR